jgi:hypothetical protein
MKINVPLNVVDHFWEQEPPGTTHEFWAFRFPVKAKEGDTIHFMIEGEEVAQAIVDKVESPGLSQCDTTGLYKNRWKVFWDCTTFKDLRPKHRHN